MSDRPTVSQRPGRRARAGRLGAAGPRSLDGPAAGSGSPSATPPASGATQPAAGSGGPSATPPASGATPRRPERIAPAALVLLDLLLVAGLGALTWRIGVRDRAFVGFPKGYDAFSHIDEAYLFLTNWPHILWNADWYSGMPLLGSSYPPFYAFLLDALHALGGFSLARATVVSTVGIVLVSVASLYGFVRVLGRGRLSAVAAAVLLVSAPILWQQPLSSGVYPRLAAMAASYVAVFLVALYATSGKRVWLVAAAVCLAIALGIHPIAGTVGVILAAGLLVAVPRWPFEVRLRRAAVLVVSVIGLSAWFYLPFLLKVHAYYLPAPLAQFVPAQAPPWRLLFGGQVAGDPGGQLPALLVPLFLVLAAVGFAAMMRPRAAWGLPSEATEGEPWRARRARLAGPLAAAAVCGAVAAAVVAYAYVGDLGHFTVAFETVPPEQFLALALWPLAAAVGVSGGALVGLVRSWWERKLLATMPLLAAAVCLLASVPVFSEPQVLFTDVHWQDAAMLPVLSQEHTTTRYRIAAEDDDADAADTLDTPTPQTRGVDNEDVLNISDQVWLESVLKDAPARFPQSERDFLVDWYAIGWIYAGPTAANIDLYQSQPGRYREAPVSPSSPDRIFAVRDPSPVLSATAAPAALVIGGMQNYEDVLQAISNAGDTSRTFIPVQGSADIDDYTLAELEQFPELVLYGFGAHDPAAAASLLQAYAHHGGGLVVEVAGDQALVDRLGLLAPGLFPASTWGQSEIYGDWNLVTSSGPLTSGIDFSDFSPAVYGTSSPWRTEEATGVAPGATADVSAAGLPVVVSGRAGGTGGQVVMSGMNLPYHEAVFTNPTEARFFDQALHLVLPDHPPDPSPARPSYRVRVNPRDPETASISEPAGGATGILYKEQDYPDWHASVDGRAATVYPAGPGMMYVALPGKGPARVTFSYGLSARELTGVGVTVLTALALVVLLLGLPERWVRERLRGVLRHLDLIP